MLHSESVIKSVIKSLKKINAKKIILDPVMVAKGGKKLIDDKAIKILKNKFLSKVNLITPNIPEAEVLTGLKITTIKDVILAGKKLLKLGAQNVLIKGGHLKSKTIEDVFINKSCDMAIKYVNHSLRTQPNLGKGHGPVNHLNSIQIKRMFR